MTNKKKKLAKNRLDKYYHLAKEQGFRSRAAFKLIQLNKKYDFLSSARAVIDLCSAPGGWLQVASKYMPISSILIGIDIVPIKPIRNTITIQADITTAKCKTELRNHLKGIKADVILHDGAPNVGTAWIQDAFSQSELVLHSLKLATEFLKPGGWFITKVFRSNDYNSLLWVFNQLFKKVEATKPQASRNTSAEIFVVCHGYIAPKKIDAKLLDPKYVFKEIDDIPNQKINIFSKNPPKRSRSGYEDGNVTLFKKISVSDFIESTTPIEMLGEYNQFEFDEKSLIYKNHKKN
jgi:AdoMet-dependent rRNA methyltransferase SPB1